MKRLIVIEIVLLFLCNGMRVTNAFLSRWAICKLSHVIFIVTDISIKYKNSQYWVYNIKINQFYCLVHPISSFGPMPSNQVSSGAPAVQMDFSYMGPSEKPTSYARTQPDLSQIGKKDLPTFQKANSQGDDDLMRMLKTKQKLALRKRLSDFRRMMTHFYGRVE